MFKMNRSLQFALFICFITTNLWSNSKPNILLIFIDDLGYGDLGCYGSETIKTPHLDKMAKEGTRFTDFYAQIVCGPSRSALLTGRYPVRSGGWSMPSSEITVAELLKKVGYKTACFGKWDVSNRANIPGRVPNDQGFDHFYGTLGANDDPEVDFFLNDQWVSRRRDMENITYDLTEATIRYIKDHQTSKDEAPFFVYLSHTMVHSVVGASSKFFGRSEGGLYGDSVEELDHEVGRLLKTLKQLEIDKETLVIFTSDNGTWSNLEDRLKARHHHFFPNHPNPIASGSSGVLREAKGSTYEGGARVPCLVRWPGKVPANKINSAIFSSLDFLPTFMSMAGRSKDIPRDRLIDGVDQSDLLLGKKIDGHRENFFYFSKHIMHGVRLGNWKLLLSNRPKKSFYSYVQDKGSDEYELYHLKQDVGEQKNLAQNHPDIVEQLLDLTKQFKMPMELPRAGIGLPKK